MPRSPKLLLCVFAVILFAASCSVEQPKRKYSDADYKQIADSIGFAVRTGDSSYIMRKLNVVEMRRRFQKAVKQKST